MFPCYIRLLEWITVNVIQFPASRLGSEFMVNLGFRGIGFALDTIVHSHKYIVLPPDSALWAKRGEQKGNTQKSHATALKGMSVLMLR